MILVIDNYDSFVHTLAGYIHKLGYKTSLKRNDEITLDDIERLTPAAIMISPGPCTPQDSGICIELIKTFGASIPILGVCLGHQAIGESYGGRTIKTTPMHGKASEIQHNNAPLFQNIPSPFTAGRYHSLITDLPEHCPLNVTAWTTDNIIMAVQHESHPVFGVQFHPESILTDQGIDVLKNFLYFAVDWNKRHKIYE